MSKYVRRCQLNIVISFLLILLVLIFYPLPAHAESLSENFVIKFDPVAYDRSQVTPGEAFQATFTGHAECNKSLPLPVSEAKITLQVVAKNTIGGTEIILNQEFIISVKPFPDKQGETYDVNESIPMQFPQDTEPGEYRITGKFLEAKGKVVFIWTDFSDYLPNEQDMGTMKCVFPGIETPSLPVLPAGSNTSPPQPTTSTTPTTSPTTSQTVTATTSPLLPPASAKEGWKSFFSWWMILVIVIAVVALLLIFIFGFRRRE